jgi:hypothetical protein
MRRALIRFLERNCLFTKRTCYVDPAILQKCVKQ